MLQRVVKFEVGQLVKLWPGEFYDEQSDDLIVLQSPPEVVIELVGEAEAFGRAGSGKVLGFELSQVKGVVEQAGVGSVTQSEAV